MFNFPSMSLHFSSSASLPSSLAGAAEEEVEAVREPCMDRRRDPQKPESNMGSEVDDDDSCFWGGAVSFVVVVVVVVVDILNYS